MTGKDMPSEEEHDALLKLIEECSEVQHVCCKILKYGWDFVPGAHYPDKAKALREEMDDLTKALFVVHNILRRGKAER